METNQEVLKPGGEEVWHQKDVERCEGGSSKLQEWETGSSYWRQMLQMQAKAGIQLETEEWWETCEMSADWYEFEKQLETQMEPYGR